MTKTKEKTREVILAEMIIEQMKQILPQAGKLVLDIGLTNEMMMLAEKIVRENKTS